jgi:hypothetical protein
LKVGEVQFVYMEVLIWVDVHIIFLRAIGRVTYKEFVRIIQKISKTKMWRGGKLLWQHTL